MLQYFVIVVSLLSLLRCNQLTVCVQDGSLAVELLMLSHRYRVYALKSLCESLIEPAITGENCLMLLEIADVHQAGRVRSKVRIVSLSFPRDRGIYQYVKVANL